MVIEVGVLRGVAAHTQPVPVVTNSLPLPMRMAIDDLQVKDFKEQISLRLNALESAINSTDDVNLRESETDHCLYAVKDCIRRNYPLISFHPDASEEQRSLLQGGSSQVLDYISRAMARRGIQFERIEITSEGVLAVNGTDSDPVSLDELRLGHLNGYLSELQRQAADVYNTVGQAFDSIHTLWASLQYRPIGYVSRLASVANVDIANHFMIEASRSLGAEVDVERFPSLKQAKKLLSGERVITGDGGMKGVHLSGKVYVVPPGTPCRIESAAGTTRESISEQVMCVTEVFITEKNGKTLISMGHDRPQRLESFETALALKFVKEQNPELYSKVSALVKHSFAEVGNFESARTLLRAEIGQVEDAYSAVMTQFNKPSKGTYDEPKF